MRLVAPAPYELAAGCSSECWANGLMNYRHRDDSDSRRSCDWCGNRPYQGRLRARTRCWMRSNRRSRQNDKSRACSPRRVLTPCADHQCRSEQLSTNCASRHIMRRSDEASARRIFLQLVSSSVALACDRLLACDAAASERARTRRPQVSRSAADLRSIRQPVTRSLVLCGAGNPARPMQEKDLRGSIDRDVVCTAGFQWRVDCPRPRH